MKKISLIILLIAASFSTSVPMARASKAVISTTVSASTTKLQTKPIFDAEQPMLLFDTSVLKEEREGQKVISYSKSTEMSDIRKARALLSDGYKAKQEALKHAQDTAHFTGGHYDKATHNQRLAQIEGEKQAYTEKYHAEKAALNAQEKNVYKKIKVIIDAIAKRLGTSEVVSYDSDSAAMSPYLTYAGHSTIDITEEVLETLNKEYTQSRLGS